MRNISFIVLICLFSVQFSQANGTSKQLGFCGYFYYEVGGNTTTLRWKDTCGNALYYQIHVKKSWSDWSMLDSVSGKDTAYILPNYSDSMYWGEKFYLLAFYDSGKVTKSKELYIVEAAMDTDSRGLSTSRNGGLGKSSSGGSGGSGSGIMDFTYSLLNFTDVVLDWNMLPNTTPLLFQISRNGDMIAEMPPNEQTYMDANLGMGSYIYTLRVHYKGGDIEEMNLRVEILPALLTINYSWDSLNNLIVAWEVTPNDVYPVFFELTCNDDFVADIPAQEGIYAYKYIVPNPTLGTFTYRLYANYATGEITVISLKVEITPASVENFNANVENIDNVLLNWEVQSNGILPQSFQIKRDNTIIAELSAEERTYLDVGLEVGTYIYGLYADYGDGEIEITNDLLVEITPAIVENFKANIENQNNVFLIWEVSSDGVQPQFFQIKRNGVIIETLEGNKRAYFDADLEVGNYIYSLYADYGNNTILHSADSHIIEIVQEDYVPEYFVYTVQEGNNIAIVWIDTSSKSVTPSFFQIERNGGIIDTIEPDKYVFFDTNLNIGTYSYRLLVSVGGDLFVVTEDPISIIIDSIPEDVPYAFPTDFIYYTENVNDVVLRWNIPYKGELQPLHYLIEKNGYIIDTVVNNVFIYFDVGVDSNTNHQYILLADYEDGKRLMSDTLVVVGDVLKVPYIVLGQDEAYIELYIGDSSKMCFPPENFVSAVVDNTVSLSWEILPGETPLHFQIERDGDVVALVENTLTYYVDAQLEIGTYIYRIATVCENGRVIYASDGTVVVIKCSE